MDFPTDPKAKRELHAAMQITAPELMADIAALRARFPGARLTYFQAGDIEVGEPLAEGVEPCIYIPTKPTTEQLEAKRKAKLAANRKKAKKR